MGSGLELDVAGEALAFRGHDCNIFRYFTLQLKRDPGLLPKRTTEFNFTRIDPNN
jgi:hypothetical protein